MTAGALLLGVNLMGSKFGEFLNAKLPATASASATFLKNTVSNALSNTASIAQCLFGMMAKSYHITPRWLNLSHPQGLRSTIRSKDTILG